MISHTIRVSYLATDGRPDRKNPWSIYIKLYPFTRRDSTTISVSKDHHLSRMAEWTAAEVNFPCFGAQKPDVIEVYGKALCVAAQLAREIDKHLAAGKPFTKKFVRDTLKRLS